MPLQFYKAQSSGKGAATSISFSSRDKCFFVEIVKQTSWIPEKRIGSFKGGQKIVTRLAMTEVGSMLASIKNKSEYKTVHKTSDRTMQISFGPYYQDDKNTGEKNVYRGFGLSLFVSKDESCRIGFTSGELEILTRYLGFGLDHCFSAIYSEDKKAADEYFKAKNAKDGGGQGGASPKRKGITDEYLAENEEAKQSSEVVTEEDF